RPTAYRTTSPSSTSQISGSSRRFRLASFLGVSQFRSSDSFAVRFTPVGETTTFVFSAWEPTGRHAFASLRPQGRSKARRRTPLGDQWEGPVRRPFGERRRNRTLA